MLRVPVMECTEQGSSVGAEVRVTDVANPCDTVCHLTFGVSFSPVRKAVTFSAVSYRSGRPRDEAGYDAGVCNQKLLYKALDGTVVISIVSGMGGLGCLGGDLQFHGYLGVTHTLHLIAPQTHTLFPAPE